MDVVRNVKVDPTVLKEPRGFIRVIQFFLAIIAFACMCNVSSKTDLVVRCMDNSTQTVEVKWGYPYRIRDVVSVSVPFCKSPQPRKDLLAGSVASQAQFFCFIGVMSFLATLVLIVLYVAFGSLFHKGTRATLIDFIGSAVWTLMWFISSAAWSDGINKLSTYTSPANIIADLQEHSDGPFCATAAVKWPVCSAGEIGGNFSLIASAIFGFLNMGVWGASLWFLYKETSWHHDQMDDGRQTFDEPQAQTPDSYQAPTNYQP